MTENPPNSPPGNTPWLRPELVAPWWKIVNVLIVMLGVGIVSGAIYGIKHTSGDFYLMISDHYLVRDGFFQSSFLCGLLFFLKWRGWKPSDFRVHLGWLTSLHGIALFFLTCVGLLIVIKSAFALAYLFQGTLVEGFIRIFLPINYGVPPGSIHLHWITIFSFVLLNAFYEEIVYMGYAFNQWAQKYGAWSAFFFTLAFRMGVHIYQGSEHILQIGIWSIIFGLWYKYQGKLWPLVLAHALIDLYSFGLLKLEFGAP